MSSKFSHILGKTRPARDTEAGDEVPAVKAAPPTELPPAPPPKGPGRPKGKRSDPAFEQVSCYLPKDVYRDVRIALLKDGRPQEFSVVVAELLSGWLDARTGE